MALIIFKYFLPMLLGYTFFVGISGRYLPIPRPETTANRPSWFLGLWTGCAVAFIATYGLHLAYRMELQQLSSLVTPGAWALSAAMFPGIIGYLIYRASVKRQVIGQQDTRVSDTREQSEATSFDNVDSTLVSDAFDFNELDETVRVENADILDIDEQNTIWADDLHHAEQEQTELDETLLFEIAPIETHEPVLIADANEVVFEAFDTQDDLLTADDTQTIEAIEAIEAKDAKDAKEAQEAQEAQASIIEDTLAEAVEASTVSESDVALARALESEALAKASEAEAIAKTLAEQTSSMAEITRLREELSVELNARAELETHLRITRNGLGALESESREFAADKADALMQMEQALEEKVKRTAAAEARAQREATKRADLETTMVHLREDALKARNESRTSVEARAQALSTANKATTLARQAMQIRTRLETQLHDAKTDLDNKQSTISSLIKALEKEKNRTREEVASMAKQLVLHEKQLHARRTLEEVTRSVNNKLSTRLVKKVAKARG